MTRERIAADSSETARYTDSPIPASAGIGLKPDHYHNVLDGSPEIGWVEIHAENYMGAGGAPHHYLSRIRDLYPLSVHGVGLSLGGAEPLDKEHLARLKALIDRHRPAIVSEHLAWCGTQGVFLNDLLPLPYTREALGVVADHVDETQETLGRRIYLENPSTYLAFDGADYSEAEFMIETARRTGCGMLFDVNNVFVQARNHGLDARAYLDAVPGDLIGEIHLAGHEIETHGDVELRIDDHGSPVQDDVWELYARLIARVGPKPTLIEWDANLPAFDVLIAEAKKADAVLRRVTGAQSLCEEAGHV